MDIKFVRGTKEKIVLYVRGDVTARKLRFVVKADKELTTDRLIEKNNTLNGGSDAQLKATYISASDRTKLEIFKSKIDDGDFTASVYYYDVRSISATDSADDVRIEQGRVTMDFSVSSDYDNTNLPADGQRYIPVLVPSTVTQAAVEDAIAKKHAHENATVLNATTESFTTALKTDYDDAVTKEHTHSNKSTLDTYTQTEADLASAVSLKHSHDNKSVLDAIAQSHLDTIAREDALYDYLFGGVLDENSTILSFDENNMILQIDEGVK